MNNRKEPPVILVVGDSCEDIFVYGEVVRMSPEAPVPIIQPTDKTTNGGMAKNVLANLLQLEVDAFLVTNTEEIVKTRYVDNRSSQMVLRVDENDVCDRIKEETLLQVKSNLFKGLIFDALVISDYCKGFLTVVDIKYLCDNNETVFVDTKKRFGTFLENADYIKINDLEYKKNFGIDFLASLWDVDLDRYNGGFKNKTIITQGRHGCLYNDEMFPVEEVSVRDVSGAGDTFLAGLVKKYIETDDIRESIKFAQECATTVVQKHGVATV